MIDLESRIQVSLERIQAFCAKWKVKEFALFGSVLRDDFTPGSDVDVLVTLEQGAGWSLYDWVDMIDELESMFGRPVDLVEKTAIRNPFRRHAILKDSKVLYAA